MILHIFLYLWDFSLQSHSWWRIDLQSRRRSSLIPGSGRLSQTIATYPLQFSLPAGPVAKVSCLQMLWETWVGQRSPRVPQPTQSSVWQNPSWQRGADGQSPWCPRKTPLSTWHRKSMNSFNFLTKPLNPGDVLDKRYLTQLFLIEHLKSTFFSLLLEISQTSSREPRYIIYMAKDLFPI